MSTTPWNPTPTLIADGQSVSASTTDPVIKALANRDQYLFERISELADKSRLVSFDMALHP